MSAKETAKRYILFIVSLFFAALGVAVTKRGELGVSPISSVANVMSSRFEGLTLGTWLILWNGLLILGQILLLGRNFKPIQLLQVPLSFLFGYFTDFGMWCAGHIPVGGYGTRVVLVLGGIVLLGFGVALSVIADVIMNSGEAFVKAVADRTGRNFGNVKIAFDVCCVAAAVVLSLVLFGGEVVGTREGTIVTALLTGLVVKFFVRRLSHPLTVVLAG